MKVTRRGQVTIPKYIRERTGIDEGMEIEFKEEKGRIVISKTPGKNPFESWVGYLKQPESSDAKLKRMRGHNAHGR